MGHITPRGPITKDTAAAYAGSLLAVARHYSCSESWKGAIHSIRYLFYRMFKTDIYVELCGLLNQVREIAYVKFGNDNPSQPVQATMSQL